MKKISIYLYSDDGATVNCEIKKPTVDQLLALQALLDATDNATGSAVIGADTTATTVDLLTGADSADHNLKSVDNNNGPTYTEQNKIDYLNALKTADPTGYIDGRTHL